MFSGNRLLNAPRFSAVLAVQQAIPLGRFGSLLFRWDGAWKDESFFDGSEGRGFDDPNGANILPKGTLAHGAYWIHNLRLAYFTPSKMIEVAAWVRNLEDITYKTFGADVPAFGTSLFFVGDPRTFGVSTSIRF